MATLSTDDVAKVVKQYERLLTKRATYEGMWQSLANLMRPTRVDIRTRRSPGTQQNQLVFDGTAVKASADLASALSGSMTPSEFPWFSLRMRLKPLNEDYDTMLWLEDCASRIHLAFQQSNFGSETHELYLDIVIFGTGCLWMEEKPLHRPGFNGFQFRSIAPGKYVVMEGPDGLVNTVMRTFLLTASALRDQWPSTHSDEVQKKIDAERGDETVEVLHLVKPKTSGVSSSLHRPYESTYVELKTKQFLSQESLRRLRFLVPRWTKVSDEEYGRGQGHVAFPDTASLNRAIEMRFKQWALALDPPLLTVDQGVIGKVKRTPGTRMIVRNIDAVKELESKARFDVAQFAEAEMRAAIRNYFFADQLQLPTKQYMTAYEIQQQVEIMQRLLGPTIGRMKYELLDLLVDNAFDIMLHAGALAPPPQAVIEAAGAGFADIDVEYESPLTKSQRTGDLVSLDRALVSARPFIEINPEVMDNFDSDAVVRHTAEVSGIPTKLMRPVDAVAAKRDQRNQEKAQAQQAALENQQADTMQKGATAISKLAPPEAPALGAKTANPGVPL